MGEGRRFSADAAKPEPGAGVIVGGLQPSVVEAKRFARCILQEQLAIVVCPKMCRGEALRPVRIKAAVKETARVGSDGHKPDIGLRTGRATLLTLLRRRARACSAGLYRPTPLAGAASNSHPRREGDAVQRCRRAPADQEQLR